MMTKNSDKKTADGETLIVKNRRAGFDYDLSDRYEGGLVLLGSEVKSLRMGKVDLVDAYGAVERNGVWLKQMNIAPLDAARSFPHEPTRARKVLLHAHEIEAIQKALTREGYTLIPTRLYFKGGLAKVELALAKGKKTVDKRRAIAARDATREAEAAMGRARRR